MNLTDPIFTDEAKAREHFEALRWPTGPYCPHCGETDRVYRVQAKTKNTRAGLLYCNSCNGSFTVTTGSAMESSHVPLNKWALAFRLMCSNKKGISAHQLHRTLNVTYKTAWFMAHRIREAMRPLDSDASGQLGGANKVVEVDETYVGGKARKRKNHVPPKEAVVALVERDGRVRSRHVPTVNSQTLKPILKAEIDKASYVMTDESTVYPPITREFGSHGAVNHSIEEYVRGGFYHTNTVESYFSILKRGVIGIYHHVSPEHLKRYLGEFDFRHNERAAQGVNDTERTSKAIKGAAGKRLTYRQAGVGRGEIPF
jgi:transposase-like protein